MCLLCHQMSSDFFFALHREISYQIKFSTLMHILQNVAIVEEGKSHTSKKKGMSERSEVFIICCLCLSYIFQSIMAPRKKKEQRSKENGNLRKCTIKKMNGWNEDMIYGEFIHTFLCMLCLMSRFITSQ